MPPPLQKKTRFLGGGAALFFMCFIQGVGWPDLFIKRMKSPPEKNRVSAADAVHEERRKTQLHRDRQSETKTNEQKAT